jgi:hypothetical protein
VTKKLSVSFLWDITPPKGGPPTGGSVGDHSAEGQAANWRFCGRKNRDTKTELPQKDFLVSEMKGHRKNDKF